jgi:hypothetical protein
MNPESSATSDNNKPFQIFRIFQGIQLSDGAAKRMAHQHHIAITTFLDVSSQPICIVINCSAWLALRVAWEIDNVSIGKMLRLVVPYLLTAT